MAASNGSIETYNFTDMLRLLNGGLFCDVASSSIRIRLGFLRKVYGIVSVQLLVTTLIAGAFITFESISYYLANSWLGLFLLVGFSFVSLIMVHATNECKTDYPSNYICLAVFTVCEAVLVGIFVTYYTIGSVVKVFGVTCALTTALAIYSMQSRRDLSSWGASLFAILLDLTAMLLMNVFLGSHLLELFLAGIGTLLFSLYIVYDVNMIMKKLPAEQYILASICLYLDIINLFTSILNLFGKRRKNDD
jgi:hypothetical protein